MLALELKDVNYSYFTKEKETKALQDINLSVKKGQFISIVGPSGCGKSTLLSIICGLIEPTSGEVIVNGRPVKDEMRNIGYMLQHDHLFEWRSVYGNVMLGLDIHRKKDTRNLATHYLSQYGLLDFKNSRPSELSGGMRQRVALIRTLMMEPDILLLDEPFSALDYQTKKEHKTAILVTHDLAEAISVGESVYVLTKRPGRFKAAIDLDFCNDLSSLERRDTAAFRDYFNILWKELSGNE